MKRTQDLDGEVLREETVIAEVEELFGMRMQNFHLAN